MSNVVDLVRVVALGLCSGLLLAACGGSDIEGKYYMQLGGAPGEGVTMELKDDGVAVMSLPAVTGLPPTSGTHSMEDGKVVVQVNNERDVFTVEDDGSLTTTKMGEKAVFVKQ